MVLVVRGFTGRRRLDDWGRPGGRRRCGCRLTADDQVGWRGGRIAMLDAIEVAGGVRDQLPHDRVIDRIQVRTQPRQRLMSSLGIDGIGERGGRVIERQAEGAEAVGGEEELVIGRHYLRLVQSLGGVLQLRHEAARGGRGR